jgi:hypothetical protein
MHPQRLPDAQIQHNLLAPPRDRISPHVAIQPLDLGPLPPATVTQPAEDLARLPGAELERRRRLRLEAGDGPSQLQHGFRFVHDVALVDEVLEPVVRGLDLAGHVGELEPDDGVVDEFLAEGAALVGVLDGFFVADAGEAEALDDDADAFVVEVGHDDCRRDRVSMASEDGRDGGSQTSEALVLLADQVLDGDFHVLECHVGGSATPDALAIHPSGADTAVLTLDQEHTHSGGTWAPRPHCSREVIAPNAVGDPLLLSIDDVVLAIFRKLGFTGQVGDIATSIRLGNGKTDALVSGQDTGQYPVHKLFLAELNDRWASDAEASDEIPYQTTTTTSRYFVGQEQLVEQIPFLWWNTLDGCFGEVCRELVQSHQTCQVSALAHLLVDGIRHFLGFVPLGDVRFDLSVDPCADFGSQGFMGLVVVGRVILSWSAKAESSHGD